MLKNIFTIFLAILPLIVGAQRHSVDYRFAPQWHQSCISFPDDSCKTLVGPLGQLMYNVGQGDLLGYVAGFGTVVQLLADENQKFGQQRLLSAKTPVVINEATYNGLKIRQETFAIAPDYTAKGRTTKTGNRADIILITIENPTSKRQTINPLLVIDVNNKTKTRIEGQTAILANGARLRFSLKPTLIRQNVADFKTLVSLEPVNISAGETRTVAAVYDNALPQTIFTDADSGETLTNKIILAKTDIIDWWETKTDIPYGHISVPDVEIQNLIDASLRGIWQAREIKRGKKAFQVGPTCYRGLWVSDGATLLETATTFDRGNDARDGVEYTLSFQKPTGQFGIMDSVYWKENGIVLWTCVRHARLMQDKVWLRSVWNKLMKTVDFIRELRARTLTNDIPLDDRLIPPGQIDGGLWGEADKAEYTNIYWNLAGLKSMIQAAEWLGLKNDQKALQAEYDDFFACFRQAAERDMTTDDFGNRYLPIPMDPEKRSLPQRAQWAFCQSVYPGQIFEPGDPIAAGTMNMLHTTLQQGMVMGTGWAIDGIWTYFAGFYGHACLWMNEPERATDALYAFANHASPVYNWREEHSPRDLTPSKYVGDMPHNWGSALFAGLAVHLLALDRGNELHLLEGLPQEWLGAGMTTALKDINTPFGKLSFTLQVNDVGTEATLEVEPLSDPLCKGIFVHTGKWGVIDPQDSRLDPKKKHKINIILATKG